MSLTLPILDAGPQRPVYAQGPRSLDAVRLLRISVTDRCNLRCVYCMPLGGVPFEKQRDLLTVDELAAVAAAARQAGVDHFKITGGEPTVRGDLIEIVERLAALQPRDLSLTTNGLLLDRLAEDLKRAGLDRLTLSCDSLRADRYERITRGSVAPIAHSAAAGGEWLNADAGTNGRAREAVSPRKAASGDDSSDPSPLRGRLGGGDGRNDVHSRSDSQAKPHAQSPSPNPSLKGGGSEKDSLLDRFWRGLEAASRAGFRKIKLNVVVIGGVNDDEVVDFARLSLDQPWTIRFIEYMPLGDSQLTEAVHEAKGCSAGGDATGDATGGGYQVDNAEIMQRIEAELGPLSPVQPGRETGVGPAQVFSLPGARGRVGFISAMSKPFCESCNRLRLTATGELRSCLFDGGEVNVLPALRPSPDPSAIIDLMRRCVAMKPETHSARGDRQMSQLGG